MKASAKKAWIKALRSGDYEQGHGQLCNCYEEFCCLGVLFDVTADSHWVSREDVYLWGAGGLFDLFVLPGSFLESVGLAHTHQEVLTEMNDVGKKSFPEIADWVEANL